MANLVTKTKVSIGTGSATPLTDTYLPIGSITNIGDFGDEPEIVKVPTIDTGRALKLKGLLDAGQFEIEVVREMADTGQNALRVASLADGEYNLKLEGNDKPTGASAKPTTIYLRGLVTTKHKHGGANDVVSQTFVFELTAAPNVIPASAN